MGCLAFQQLGIMPLWPWMRKCLFEALFLIPLGVQPGMGWRTMWGFCFILRGAALCPLPTSCCTSSPALALSFFFNFYRPQRLTCWLSPSVVGDRVDRLGPAHLLSTCPPASPPAKSPSPGMSPPCSPGPGCLPGPLWATDAWFPPGPAALKALPSPHRDSVTSCPLCPLLHTSPQVSCLISNQIRPPVFSAWWGYMTVKTNSPFSQGGNRRDEDQCPS